MALFHLSIRTEQRSAGQSATDRAAYILRTKIADERTGKLRSHTNTRLAPDTVDLGSILPCGRRTDAATLWNSAEMADRRRNARPARTMNIALPLELSRAEQAQALDDFAAWIRKTFGAATTAALHLEHTHNPHGHLMMATRAVDDSGHFGSRIKAFDGLGGRQTVRRIRAKWADICNQYLTRHGIAPITHLSLAAQGIDEEPMAHRGAKEHYRMIREDLGITREQWEEINYVNAVHGLEVAQAVIRRITVRSGPTGTDGARTSALPAPAGNRDERSQPSRPAGRNSDSGTPDPRTSRRPTGRLGGHPGNAGSDTSSRPRRRKSPGRNPGRYPMAPGITAQSYQPAGSAPIVAQARETLEIIRSHRHTILTQYLKHMEEHHDNCDERPRP